jgi:hypothetical protein
MQQDGQYQSSKGEKKKPEKVKLHFFGLMVLCERTNVLTRNRIR